MSRRSKLVALACVAATVPAVLAVQSATATHEPANKMAISSSNTDAFDDATPILQERMKVSSTHDLMLQLTAECSIITELATGGNNPDMSEAAGTVNVWIEIDETPVPIQSAGDTADDGDVVLCNRVYGRSVEDTEGDGDVDAEDDYIRTRQANAFNWVAFDVGKNYDDPANGNNILDIKVMADYETSEVGEAVADAWVGQRSLIAEPTNASNHEGAQPVDENDPGTLIEAASLP